MVIEGTVETTAYEMAERFNKGEFLYLGIEHEEVPEPSEIIDISFYEADEHGPRCVLADWREQDTDGFGDMKTSRGEVELVPEQVYKFYYTK